MDILQDLPRVSNVTMTEQSQVHVSNANRINPTRHAYRGHEPNPRELVKPVGCFYGAVALRDIKRRSTRDLRVCIGKQTKSIGIHIRRREDDLSERHPTSLLSLLCDSIDCPQNTPVPHAVRNNMNSFGSAAAYDIEHEICNVLLTSFNACRIGDVPAERTL